MNKKEFKNPGAQYRGLPFWSLNGKLEKDELIRQVGVLKEMGMGGAFIHSRTGLATEYMSDEWMELVRVCALEMEKLGMKAYLYDEDRWPSGTAGGLVTAEPRFRQKFIAMDILEPEQFSAINYSQNFVAAFAAKIDGNNIYDYYPVQFSLNVKEGYKVLAYHIQEQAPQSFYNGYTYLDTLNREATEKFIELTHEKYKAACGDMFGKELLGIFTDEPHRGAFLNSFGLLNAGRETFIPWTYELFCVFKERQGYDVRDILPEVWFKKDGKPFSRAAYHYIETLMQMFLENFAKPYHDWCRKNKLIVTGHVLHEDSLSCQTTMCGSVMRYYEYMDYPGVDILTEGNGNFWVAKQVYSAAKQLGKKFVLSELYGCTGWQMSFQSHKAVGDWQSALGISLRCHHLSWYTMSGEAKRDYPASIFFQSGWYKDYNYVEDYFARINAVIMSGKSVTELLVVSPIESAWGLSHYKTYVNAFGVTEEEYQQLENEYNSTFKFLADNGIDFDYADEEMLSRLYSVTLEDGKPVLKVGKMRYSKVLVSGLMTIRNTTLQALEKFAALGGEVVFSGRNPSYIDGVEADKLPEFKRIKFSGESFAGEFCSKAKVNILLTNQNGEPCKNMICHIRELKDGYFVFIVNSDRENAANGVRIAVDKPLAAEIWDLRSGEIIVADFKTTSSGVSLTADFAPAGEILLRLKKDAVAKKKSGTRQLKQIALPDKFKVTLNEPNALVLDFAEYFIDGKKCGADEVLRIDQKIRSEFNMRQRGGEMIQPWFAKKYLNASADDRVCSLDLDFTFAVQDMPEKISLALETPEKWTLNLNGAIIPSAPVGTFIDNSLFVVEIEAALLKQGENKLRLSAVFNDVLDLENIYLLGDFGVKIKKNYCVITKFAGALKAGDLAEQGLPFYSGAITYHIPVKKGVYDVVSENMPAALIKAAGEDEEKIIAFAPFEAKNIRARNELKITLVNTRKNLFGPLHLVPAVHGATAPEHFRTTGDFYTQSFNLIPQGLGDIKILKVL